MEKCDISYFNFYLFEATNSYDLTDDVPLKDYIKILSFDFETSKPKKDLSKVEFKTYLPNIQNYGTACGIYYLWKNTSFPYYGFSLVNQIPDITSDELKSFLTSGKDILYVTPQLTAASLQENYRSRYFSYDFRMLISVLKKNHLPYYEFTQKEVVDKHLFIIPSVIMSKDCFRKFCVWAFPILETCKQHLSDKYSIFQNLYLEHLMYYLLHIYIKYNEKNLKAKIIDKSFSLNATPIKSIDLPSTLSRKEALQKLMNERHIEEACDFVKTYDSTELQIYSKIFEQYNREKRYYKTTLFESSHNLDDLVTGSCLKTNCSNHKNVLVIQWNSVSHNETLLAFDKLGLTYDCFPVGDVKTCNTERTLDTLNYYMDSHTYDCVFSLNYFTLAAEASYIHNTTYVAWTYDSPITIDNYDVAKYPTTNLFLFDSKETEYFKSRGISGAKYMPLAVNVEKYDSIICSPEDIDKYSASVSFVGSLYDNKLNEAMKPLSDYKKAYINSLIDCGLYTRNYDLLERVLSEELMKFLSNKHFNKTINGEWDKEPSSDTVSSGRLKGLINKTITNRERLIIISLLSNHWDFKLYSYSTHEVFKKTIECGTVDYYNEMPKVFKCSKLNLNMTLRNIQTGIPLRCLDIMGCHGALLSNHQKDFDEDFKDGYNLIFYDEVEEAYDKANYYLNHQDVLTKIASNGYETVKELYNYPLLMKKVLIESGLKEILKENR